MPSAKKSSRQTAAPRAMRLSPEERREQLLACAVKVFALHGLVAANHGLVAAAAKVSVPTVFFYFKTRDDLVEAVLDEIERFYTKTLTSAIDPKLPAADALLKVTHAMSSSVDTHPDHCRIMMEWGISVRSTTWPRYLRLHRQITRNVAKLIERGQQEGSFRRDLDPMDEAAILHATSSALVQLRETGASQERIDRFERSIVQSVLTQSFIDGQTAPAAKAPRPAARSVKSAATRRSAG